MRNSSLLAAAIVVGTLGLVGCSHTTYVQPPVAQAPPMNSGVPVSSGGPGGPGTAGVYQWQDVPSGQQVPVSRAIFDQGGYQIIAQTGETIIVPFANQNLYVMRFGRTNGQPYFENAGDAPVLYLPPNFALENSANANARWYPLPADYTYTRPVYVSLAPSWNDYVGMNWYSGMSYYGGMWGYTPRSTYWMPNFYINIGGTPYRSYSAYRTYYVSHPGIRYTYNNTIYTNRSTGSFGSRRTVGSTGSFGSGRTTGSFGSGRSTGTTGSFGSGRSMGNSGSTGSFGSGRSTGSGGSFGSGRSMGTTGSGGSFGTRPAGSTGSSFGSGRSSGSSGSFGGGSPTIRPTSPPSGSSFGGSRSTGGSGSFGGGRSSGSGGGSFGGGRSGGSSFGGSRRR
jgi:hypothetical protein